MDMPTVATLTVASTPVHHGLASLKGNLSLVAMVGTMLILPYTMQFVFVRFSSNMEHANLELDVTQQQAAICPESQASKQLGGSLEQSRVLCWKGL